MGTDMEKDTIVLTRKIQLFVDSDDKEKRTEYYGKLFEWQDIVFRGANMVLSHQYMQEQMKDLIYLREDVKVKLGDFKKDPEGILTMSKMNTTYRILSLHFKGRIPTDILTTLNTGLHRLYNAERTAYWKGDKSLRNYKKTMPIPFSAKAVKLSNVEGGKGFKLELFKIPFRTFLGKDKSDKKVLLQRALVGQIKICGSSLQIVKGKLFLLLALELPKQQHDLKAHVIAEASLSVEHPITVQVGKENYQIGSKEEFLCRRMAIQGARHRVQRASRYNKGGKGRKKKMKALDQFADKEKSYVNSRLHLYSRMLIDICIKSQAGTLLLVNQTNKEELAKEDEFLLRNWSYYGLIEKIKYKANKAGINLIVE